MDRGWGAVRGAVFVGLTAALLISCSSKQGKESPQGGSPKATPAPGSQRNAPEEAPPPPTEEIRIKGGSIPEASYLDHPPDPGNFSVDVKQADLERVVLPIFTKQTKVPVDYKGTPHKITIRLENVPWRDALAIICQWSMTHLGTSETTGHIEMRDGSADTSTRAVLEHYEPPQNPQPPK